MRIESNTNFNNTQTANSDNNSSVFLGNKTIKFTYSSSGTSPFLPFILTNHVELENFHFDGWIFSEEIALQFGRNLERFPCIKELTFTNCSFDKGSLANFLAKTDPNKDLIRNITFDHTNFGPTATQNLTAFINEHKSLTSFEMRNSQGVERDLCRAFRTVITLESISFTYMSMSSCMTSLSETVEQLPFLHALTLDSCGLQDQDVMQIGKAVNTAFTNASKYSVPFRFKILNIKNNPELTVKSLIPFLDCKLDSLNIEGCVNVNSLIVLLESTKGRNIKNLQLNTIYWNENSTFTLASYHPVDLSDRKRSSVSVEIVYINKDYITNLGSFRSIPALQEAFSTHYGINLIVTNFENLAIQYSNLSMIAPKKLVNSSLTSQNVSDESHNLSPIGIKRNSPELDPSTSCKRFKIEGEEDDDDLRKALAMSMENSTSSFDNSPIPKSATTINIIQEFLRSHEVPIIPISSEPSTFCEELKFSLGEEPESYSTSFAINSKITLDSDIKAMGSTYKMSVPSTPLIFPEENYTSKTFAQIPSSMQLMLDRIREEKGTKELLLDIVKNFGGKERELLFRDYFQNNGYQVRDVPGDGNCYYYAIDQAIENGFGTNDSLASLEMRRMVTDLMRQNPTKFGSFIDKDDRQYQDLDQYCQAMSKNYVWTGEFEGDAVIQLLNLKYPSTSHVLHLYDLPSMDEKFLSKQEVNNGIFSTPELTTWGDNDHGDKNIRHLYILREGYPGHYLALIPKQAYENTKLIKGNLTTNNSLSRPNGSPQKYDLSDYSEIELPTIPMSDECG